MQVSSSREDSHMVGFVRVEDLWIWDCRRGGFRDFYRCVCSNGVSGFVYPESYSEIWEYNT